MMLSLPIILTILSYTSASKLNLISEWKYVDYDWECEEDKAIAISEDRYDCETIFILDAQKVKDRIFVTTPAQYPGGVPASVSTVSKKKGPGGPLLEPYPNWCWHNSPNCEGITSVRRMTVDDCDRIWLLDSGRVGPDQVCPAKFLVFDSKTDELLQTIAIPDDISHNPRNKSVGRLSHPTVETRGKNCEETLVYAADSEGGGLVVYDGKDLWRLDDPIFHPEPIETNYTVAGEKFPLANLFVGLALTHETPSQCSRLFFRGIATVQENFVYVDDLHKSRTSKHGICSTTYDYCFSSPITSQGVSRDGILFFGLGQEIAIGCWNTNAPLDDEHIEIVAQDDETLQLVSTIKFSRCPHDPYDEEIFVLSNRLQKIFAGTLNINEVNYRIFNSSVKNLIKGCKCAL